MKRAWRADGGGAMPWRKTRPSTHDRPPEVVTRDRPCDWKTTVPTAEETDTILFSAPGQGIVITYERRSRLMLARRARSLKADHTAPGGGAWGGR